MTYLKQLLEEKKMTQTEFARRIGLTRSYTCELVNGKKSLGKLPAHRIGDIFIVLGLNEKERAEFVKEIIK